MTILSPTNPDRPVGLVGGGMATGSHPPPIRRRWQRLAVLSLAPIGRYYEAHKRSGPGSCVNSNPVLARHTYVGGALAMGQLNDPSMPWRDQLSIDSLAPALDQAFETGNPICLPDLNLIVVPDVVLLQGEANGLKAPPDTWTIERVDGRRAYLYRADPARMPKPKGHA